ncbi:DUF2267 domain-containing protein [Lentzea sp. HUAS TT2]|uniref:DUF2267 domain-containing protein n=1 Tax=Lentzea sp. HUAS TT2 TaxID=3447454 RepID=UPI003F72B0FC
MTTTRTGVFDHALESADKLVRDVAEAFPTEDRKFAHRVLRAWLHLLRDRLTVEVSAHFAAQLPELVRGMYYEGWNPSRVPEKYDAEQCAARLAGEANVARKDVTTATAAVASVVPHHLSDGMLDKVLAHFPEDVRRVLAPLP